MADPNLIDSLAGELKPFKPMTSPWRRTLVLLALALGCAVAYPAYYGWRHDLEFKIGTLAFWVEIGTLFITIGFTSVVLPMAMVPGTPLKRSWIVLSGVPYLLWLILISIFGNLSQANIGTGFWHGGCFESVLMFSILPLVVVIYQIRKGAPTMLFVTGLLAGAYSVAVAALAQELHCGFNDTWHIVSQHFFPVAIITVLSTLLGRWLLRW